MPKWGLIAIFTVAAIGITILGVDSAWAQSGPGDITGDFAEGIGAFIRVLLNIVVDFFGAILTEASCFLREFFVDNPPGCTQRGL